MSMCIYYICYASQVLTIISPQPRGWSSPPDAHALILLAQERLAPSDSFHEEGVTSGTIS